MTEMWKSSCKNSIEIVIRVVATSASFLLFVATSGDLAIYANPRCRSSKVSYDRESSKWLRVRYDPR